MLRGAFRKQSASHVNQLTVAHPQSRSKNACAYDREAFSPFAVLEGDKVRGVISLATW